MVPAKKNSKQNENHLRSKQSGQLQPHHVPEQRSLHINSELKAQELEFQHMNFDNMNEQ